MKKKLFVTGILITGVLTLSPISLALSGLGNNDTKEDVMYANLATMDNSSQQENTKENEDLQSENTYSQNDLKHESLVESDVKNKQRPVETNQDQIINKSDKKKLNANVIDDKQKSIVDDKITKSNSLSRNDALNLLKKRYGSDVYYEYMGNEADFGSIKEKGHEGYVYLPHKPTDMGYFVDKNTKEIYEFHPSGYFDLVE